VIRAKLSSRRRFCTTVLAARRAEAKGSPAHGTAAVEHDRKGDGAVTVTGAVGGGD